jgi:hypothetical protein
MSQAISAGGGIVRIIDLTFKLTGFSEDHREIQGVIARAQQAISILIVLYATYRAVMIGMGPLGWIMLGASLLGVGASVFLEVTDKEETVLRGH